MRFLFGFLCVFMCFSCTKTLPLKIESAPELFVFGEIDAKSGPRISVRPTVDVNQGFLNTYLSTNLPNATVVLFNPDATLDTLVFSFLERAYLLPVISEFVASSGPYRVKVSHEGFLDCLSDEVFIPTDTVSFSEPIAILTGLDDEYGNSFDGVNSNQIQVEKGLSYLSKGSFENNPATYINDFIYLEEIGFDPNIYGFYDLDVRSYLTIQFDNVLNPFFPITRIGQAGGVFTDSITIQYSVVDPMVFRFFEAMDINISVGDKVPIKTPSNIQGGVGLVFGTRYNNGIRYKD
jgi:Domain of unknown function (DUF4249)